MHPHLFIGPNPNINIPTKMKMNTLSTISTVMLKEPCKTSLHTVIINLSCLAISDHQCNHQRCRLFHCNLCIIENIITNSAYKKLHASTLVIDVCNICTVYPKKYAHGYCFAVLCCGYTLTDCPISIRFTSLALWQSNDCPSASKATLMNMDKYFMWIHYERLHNHNKAKHNKTVCIFLGIYCMPLSTTYYQSHVGILCPLCGCHTYFATIHKEHW